MVNHDEKKSSAELRSELRALRKEHVKPISRMRVGDISAEIQKLKVMREETPAPAAVPSVAPQKYKAAVETVKEAKKAEFPVMPAGKSEAKSEGKAKASKAPKAEPEKKKMDKKAMMAKLMAMMEDD